MIGFRVDANETVATGHLMRCIAIAKACLRQGENCIFFLAEEKETERLRSAQLPYRILNTDYREMEQELPQLETLIKTEQLTWLVVDSYQISVSYLKAVQKMVPVLYMDDMREDFYPVSAVLQYIPGKMDGVKRYREAGIPVLEGFSYAPLREEFIAPREAEREKSVLITTGGTDAYNVAGKVLKFCLSRQEFSEYVFHVIIGSMNAHEHELKYFAGENLHIVLHRNITNIHDYMSGCEMAVSAGGTTLLELCACKTPTVCFSFADNQRGFAEEMGRQGVMRYAGDARQEADIGKKIGEQLLALAVSKKQRRRYVEQMGKLVDGRGADRIADFLKNPHAGSNVP